MILKKFNTKIINDYHSQISSYIECVDENEEYVERVFEFATSFL
jgi:hypothetical protein